MSMSWAGLSLSVADLLAPRICFDVMVDDPTQRYSLWPSASEAPGSRGSITLISADDFYMHW